MSGTSHSGLTRATWLARRAATRAGVALVGLVALPVRWLSGFGRRDPRLAVWGAPGNRFVDNARYAFVGLAGRRDVRCIWITGDAALRDEIRALGFESELRWSRRGIGACLRAGWYVYDAYVGDISFFFGKGARTFNLWHGIPLKAIEFDIDTGPLGRVYHSRRWSPVRLAFLDRFIVPDYLLSTSRFITERCFASAFRIPPERCFELGYPRTDQLFHPEATKSARTDLGLDPDVAGVVGYFPTWRDDGYDFISASGFDFDAINHVLAAANRVLVFKPHPNFADIVPRESHWSHVRILPPEQDLHATLAACDLLITDYSSIAYDFLLLDRPMIHFVPDLERYTQRRNVYFTFDEMAVGPVVTSCDELYSLIGGDWPIELDIDRHHALRRRLWGDYAGNATEAIGEFLASAPS